jgi:benzoyl-CoA reductase/2-hydroxyglutaryl-CoA dehydratase subunit BcrC/BadD/HgdB
MSATLIEKPVRQNHALPKQPKAAERLDALRKSYTLAAAQQAVAEGESVVWGGTFWESPLLHACDTQTVNLAELWREDSYKSEAIAESHFQIPSEFCSMIKTIIGRLRTLKDNNIKRILYFGSICEPIAMVLEHARRDAYELHIIETVTSFNPGDKRPEMVLFLVKELQKVSVWLTGKPADEDRVRAEIRRKNTIARKLRRILQLRLKSPFYLPSAQLLPLLVGEAHYYGNVAEFEAVLDQFIVELEEAAKTPETEPYIPLLLAGLFGASQSGATLLKSIEDSRGFVAGFVIHSSADYREDIPPLEALAHYVFDAQSRGELGEVCGASATHRRIRVEELLKETGSRGIISSSTTGCPYGSMVQQLERDYFKKNGIPLIALETTVHNELPTEEQITRVKAFIEMLS